MEKLTLSFESVVDKLKKDKSALNQFKHLAANTKNYEFAAALRDFEREHFPITAEKIKAEKEANDLDLALRMTGIDVKNMEVVYTILQVVKAHAKMKGKFDLKTASKIACDAKEFFK
ncbi:MAG: hypothetical protein RLZZ196_973 [Bacteroidota bacterium]|jgi:hypothetical protein